MHFQIALVVQPVHSVDVFEFIVADTSYADIIPAQPLSTILQLSLFNNQGVSKILSFPPWTFNTPLQPRRRPALGFFWSPPESDQPIRVYYKLVVLTIFKITLAAFTRFFFYKQPVHMYIYVYTFTPLFASCCCKWVVPQETQNAGKCVRQSNVPALPENALNLYESPVPLIEGDSLR